MQASNGFVSSLNSPLSPQKKSSKGLDKSKIKKGT